MKKSLIFVKYVILVCLVVVSFFPVLFMITNSFMESNEILEILKYNTDCNISLKLIPENVTFLQYYNVLFRTPTFLYMFWNSVLITISILCLQVIVSSMGAYAFAKLRFPCRDQIFFIYIIVMLMPFQVTLVPNYIIFGKLNLLGSYLSIILPGAFSTFGIFLLRQFMVYIPNEYMEAAKIDGANYVNIFFKIIIPQSKSGIASLIILSFIDNWNMVEQPLIFLKDKYKYPLSIYLSYINQNDLGIAFACGVLYMIPAILIYLNFEDYLIKGIQISGLK